MNPDEINVIFENGSSISSSSNCIEYEPDSEESGDSQSLPENQKANKDKTKQPLLYIQMEYCSGKNMKELIEEDSWEEPKE